MIAKFLLFMGVYQLVLTILFEKYLSRGQVNNESENEYELVDRASSVGSVCDSELQEVEEVDARETGCCCVKRSKVKKD